MTSDLEERLYHDLAWTWPILSPPEHYVEEAGQAIQLIRTHSQIPVKTLLHLGCGGGHLDRTLKHHVAVLGIDRSEEMLALARTLNPEVRYQAGDIRTVRLEETFDAVAVFDSITYVLTIDDLRWTFRTAFHHLKEGGVFLTYAEETAERFRQDRTRVTTGSQGDTVITFVEHAYDADPTDTMFETAFVFLIRRADRLDIETDRHRGGLFPIDAWTRVSRDAGFETRIEGPDPTTPDQVSWLVCVKARGIA